jgi:hypothetical protein
MEIKNSHQVTCVCHCITTNGQMPIVHIGSNDFCGCGTMTYRVHLMTITRHNIYSNEYKSQAGTGQLLAFEPLLQTYL